MNDERRWEGHSRLKRPGAIVAPLLVTALGAGWLLTAQGFIPGVQWAWVLALAALGALVVTVKGPDKFLVCDRTALDGDCPALVLTSDWSAGPRH